MEARMGVLFEDMNVPALFGKQRRNRGACRSTSDHQYVTTDAGGDDRRKAVHQMQGATIEERLFI
jgi:hypothetical protein